MKIKDISICLLWIFLIPGVAYTQTSDQIFDTSSDPEEIKTFFLDNISKEEDKYYLYDDWKIGDIYFKSGTAVKGYPLQYDLHYNLLEIKIDDQIKVMTINRLDRFEILNEENGEMEAYTSSEGYINEDGASLTGICKLHSIGNYEYITNIYHVLKEPDYIQAFDVGNKEPQLFIKNKSYLCCDHIAYPRPTSKKGVLRLFGDKSRRAKAYVDQEDLNVRKSDDLIKLVDYMNEFPGSDSSD